MKAVLHPQTLPRSPPMSFRNSVIVALSVFYAMVISIFALVFELAHLLTGENRRVISVKDLLFGMYM